MANSAQNLLRYSLAVGSVALAIGVRLLLDPVLGIQFPFATVFFAVLLTAWYGGFRPAVAAVILGAIASDYFLLLPRCDFTLSGLDNQAGLILFVLVGFGIALLGGQMHRAQKKAEVNVEKEQRQIEIIDQTYDAVIEWKWGGRITFWNNGAERLYGFSRTEAIGQVTHRLLQTKLFGGAQVFIKALEKDGAWEGELQQTTQDGKIISVESRMVLARQGEQTYVLEANRDITELKRVERERMRLALVAENTGDFVGMCDMQGIPFYANRAAIEMVGLESLETTIQTHVREFFFPEDQAFIVDEFFPRVLREGSGEVEIRFRHFKTGKALWMIYHVFVLSDLDGQIGLATVSRNITERKRAEEALRESEQRLLLAQQVAHIGTFDWNIQTGVNQWTPELEAMYGLERGSFKGIQQAWENLVHPEDREEAIRRVSMAIDTGSFEGEWRVIHPDGTIRWIAGRAWGFKDDSGKPLRLIGVNIDITARKQAEEEIRKLNEDLEQRVVERTAQLEAANKELEAFSYSVSHDLRAPLRAIDGFSQALVEDCGPQLSELGRRYLGTIRKGAQQMGELIDDLLTFSRLSRQPLNKRMVDAEKLVRDCFEELNGRQQGRWIDLRIGKLPPCNGDPVLLKQIWINLMSNALKYTGRREQAVIEVGCSTEDGKAVYFIRDNGAGFDMRYVDKLYGVFQRLHRADEFEGTGVGLAIVQRIVHRHGGQVRAEAAVDQGATFSFTLDGGANI